ncbi:anthranilate phosphoribosyltransferase [Candidatus Methylomirabilis sp.]|uniref:anthranilate phosphoribosyltransferase n=1 Tax=Candidatus Methylomirabilis sp. TaxID=2032687 RepID=UPI002A603754|nr:anthranilate phosphoribosyltransferase [Candidatus Methylomirabilis sp.]
MILEALQKVVERRDLSPEEAFMTMEEMMSGKASDPQIAAFLTALRCKGETVGEITSFARAMRTHVSPVVVGARCNVPLLVDTCGTGGDAGHTFNISTAAAFVTAGTGVRVAKHGNRSVSSLCGSADVMEALGVDLTLTPEQVGNCIDEVGIGFLYAPLLHTAMRYVMTARRDIRIRTVFNILGPLTNPAGASAQVVGVYEDRLTELLASALNDLGSKRAFVVFGLDGLDELSPTGESRVSEVKDGHVHTYVVSPEDFGLQRATLRDLQGGSAAENAAIIKKILGGEMGPKRDVVVMNAALAIVAGGKADDFKEGVRLAARSIDAGAAMEKLCRLVEFSRRYCRQ